MPTTTFSPMDNLAERIAQQQAELESLHKELESRQARIARLNEKKDVLEQRLRQLDADIEAVSRGKKPGRPGKALSVKPSPTALPAKTSHPQTLVDLLVEIVSQAQAPIPVKKLAAEVEQRNFPTTSKNIAGMVQTRVNELVRLRIFRRARKRKGVVLARPKGGSRASAAKPVGRKKARKKGRAPNASRIGADGQKKASLRTLVTEILTKSTQPLTARELAEQAIAQGYETKSKNFTTVMSVLLTRLNSVENVAGQGYRLKKG